MFKSIVTWGLIAATFVAAEPIPRANVEALQGLQARDDTEPQDLDISDFIDGDVDVNAFDTRDVELNDFAARNSESNDFDVRNIELNDLEARDIDTRAVRNLSATANFDSLISSGLGTRQIGYYGGLSWQGIAPVKLGTSILSGLVPFSAPNGAAYGTLTQLTNNVAVITAQFDGSKTQSFAIDQFYFGCTAANLGGISLIPTKCKMAIAGYNKANTLIAYKSFTFTPSAGLKANMILAKLPTTFKGLNHVRLASSYSLNVLGGTALDNFKYTITTTA